MIARMNLLKIWSRVTIVVGALMGTIPLFHVWEMYMVSSSKGQSLSGAIFFEFGVMTWLIYGILIKDRIIIACNGIAVFFGLIYISAIMHYSDKTVF
jgi:uncharacterized protein with PQ loop repeat